jgi:hypothetical protein
MNSLNYFRTFLRWLMLFIDPRKIVSWTYLPRYLKHWRQFQSRSDMKLRMRDSYPCLSDWVSSTPYDPHYFYQAAWLARRLAANIPEKHVDIGSDVRLINVLSAFVPTEFLDYRPLQARLSGLTCGSGNLVALSQPDGSIHSLSCLHVVEHVGLGRYGDPVDPGGSDKALGELQRVLAPQGRLYLSLPVGRERVCFNAHRVFDPRTIIGTLGGLRLTEFSLVDDDGAFHESVSPDRAAGMEYGCGLFVFERSNA